MTFDQTSRYALKGWTFRKSVLLPLTLAALCCLSPTTPTFAQAQSSVTIDGRSFTIVGGSSQSISPAPSGARLEIDGQVIEIGATTLEMAGHTYTTTENGSVRVEVTGTTISVFVADALIASIEAAADASPLTLEQAQALADAGDANAQNEMGYAYQFGTGVEIDLGKAVEFYRLAAEQGFARAQFNLGLMYERGTGVEADLAKARHWYELAAEQDYPSAVAQLGWLYAEARGVEQDTDRAAEYYQHAADLGSAFAQLELGVMYFNGEGLAQDQARGVELFTLAAEQGGATAQHNLSIAYKLGLGVEIDDAVALSWLEKAAAQNHSGALNDLGARYLDGQGVAQNTSRGIELLEQAAALGHIIAMTNLAWQYQDGNGVEVDLVLARQWLEEAAELGSTDAQEMLASLDAAEGAPDTAAAILPSFYVLRPDRTQVVLDNDALRAEIAAGSITEGTYVWRSGMTDWQHAGDVDEFTGLFGA